MPIDISYNGSSIYTSSSGVDVKLLTSGKFMEDDVLVSVPVGSATTPGTTVTANPSISVSSGGLITASVSASQSVTPTVSPGYVSSGTAGNISVSGTNTSQLSTQAAQTITPTTTAQTISSGKYLTGTQTVEAVVCSNLTAANIVSGVTVKVGTATDDDSVASVTGTASSGYDETLIKNWIERSNSFTTLNWPSGLTSIGDYAFTECGKFTSALPDTVTSIGIYAFYGCKAIAWTSLPSSYSAATIPQYAFYDCRILALTSLPNSIQTIGTNAFYSNARLALTSFPSNLTRIDSSAFYGCSNLQVTSLPSSVTYIGSTAFYNCPLIPSISCDGTITTLGSNAFLRCSSITSASFPNLAVSSLTTVFGSISTAAYACQLLEFADIGNAAAIAANSFANCYALETLVIRKTGSICTLANVSAFLNTPMSGYNSLTGTVYVPSALISSYQSASNWSTLYTGGTVTFTAIEGSDYELS